MMWSVDSKYISVRRPLFGFSDYDVMFSGLKYTVKKLFITKFMFNVLFIPLFQFSSAQDNIRCFVY